MKKSILLIEDSLSLKRVLIALFTSEGYEVEAVDSAEDALSLLKKKEYDLILADFKLPKKNGIELVEDIRSFNKSIPIIIMTAYATISMAVDAIKKGANDFITKPFEPQKIISIVESVLTSNVSSRAKIKDFEKIFLTNNKETLNVLEQAKKASLVDTTVLILGESGTGKELLAKYIYKNSNKSDKPFATVNCAAIPDALLESELFGHEKGAFTGATQKRIGIFEYAKDGVVFLDEIGEIPPYLQVKLLRALQEREIKPIGSNKPVKINTKIIAATNIDIKKAIKEKMLREDLYYRLAVIELKIPPLRERPEDIELLANYFLKKYSIKFSKENLKLTDKAREKILSYYWPGNVRELENSIERAVLLTNSSVIEEEDLNITSGIDYNTLSQATMTLPQVASLAVRKAEQQTIKEALVRTKGNKSKAAKFLGVSYKTLLNKIKEYKIEEELSL